MATPGEQPAEVVSVEMPAPDGWTKKVGGHDDLLPDRLTACLSARSLARVASSASNSGVNKLPGSGIPVPGR
jgi:hypothetical protein